MKPTTPTTKIVTVQNYKPAAVIAIVALAITLTVLICVWPHAPRAKIKDVSLDFLVLKVDGHEFHARGVELHHYFNCEQCTQDRLDAGAQAQPTQFGHAIFSNNTFYVVPNP